MTKEALKLALEALELHGKQYPHMVKGYCLDAITAIKEALAQPEHGWTSERIAGIARLKDAQDKRLAQPEQEPLAWKLVPVKPTDEMLKAMDECSTEGYDERLLAGHASSVYMAAVDVAPTPPQRKPLSDEEIILIVAECASSHQHTDIHFARAIEAAHGIKRLV